MRNISSWSIRNPVPSIVLFLALTLAGMLSFMRMSVNQQPEITFPAVVIIVQQPGAAPTELETQITQIVESAVRNLEGVDEINSTISEGMSETFVQFTIETPVDRATTDVRDAIAQIRAQLPDGIIEPQVKRVNVNGGNLANFSVEATDMTMNQLSWFVKDTVSKRLLAVDGMQSVTTHGAVDREIRVILDPARMQAQGVTATQINTQLRAMNVNAAGGRAEIAGAEQSVRVLGNATDAFTLGQTQIQLANGRSTRLADIATVRDTYAEQRSIAKMEGKPTISFGIVRSRGASDVAVYDGALKVLTQIEKENPRVHFIRRATSVSYTLANYKAAMRSMVEGAILAVVIVFLFLRDKRATVISALAIPLSAIPTFWVLSLMGFTLNFMTLLALSLVSGVLVDDAIVEIENIVRHMRMGKTAYQAAIDAADEIGLAVVGTTFSIVAVFLPVGLMPGIAGQFFKNFGLTVVIAVLMSLAVARLITPMVAAYFLKSHGAEEHGGGRAMDFYMKVLAWTLNERHGTRRSWKRLFVRDNRKLTMLIGVAAFILTIAAYATLPFTFQPPNNVDTSYLNVTMAPGTTLAQTEAVADEATRILRQQQEVKTAVEYVDVGSAQVVMTLRDDRKRSSIDFEREMSPMLNRIPDARISFQSQNGGGGSTRDVSVMLAGTDPLLLTSAASKVVDGMKALPGLRAPRIEGDLPRPEIVIRPRLDLAADLGVTTAALSQTIRIATLGDIDQNVAKFSLSDRQIPIRVMLNEDSRRDLSTIQDLPVQTSRGTTVPLKVVADIGFGAGPSQIQRFNQERRVVISADLAPGGIAGEQRALVMKLPQMQSLPPGVHYAAAGDAKWQAEMLQNFVIALIAGVMLVFAVLVLLYRRVMPPFVNLASLLLAPLGGAVALHLAGMAVSLPVLIGILMLFGIVAKNSILLIDFAIEEIRHGRAIYESILDAGHKRAQPIVMTTVAMVAGMMPTALSIGGDGSWNQPMAVTVIGGLILSTLLTLLIVPAGFSLADGLERWLGPRLARTLTNGGEGDPTPVAHPAE
ncbi:efflux RND transporter permease subunit [Sphingomonas nostoxanthinifaciens]|uniref:efflux RND transporter permease subunit n=1 Tax=Sphingomonas nostoxanthinifaciens TaxID=2872652 RepID=UPI001CC1E0BE|nr:efflux RND transporter permease subunit [Sphingomonas nostoxanthinifaciens]UAK25966.1 efflux RND transporter permease subunit [Sphingomonas nostoxanthinifaciens]